MRIAPVYTLLALAAAAAVGAQNPAPSKSSPPSPFAPPSSSPLNAYPASPSSGSPVSVARWKTENGTVTVYQVQTACPLAMEVRQGLGGHLLETRHDGSQSDTFAARLNMLLRDLRPDKSTQKMRKATVTVQGLNGRDHLMGLNWTDDQAYRISRTLTVPLNDSGAPDLTAELRLPGFTATTWVQLQSVTYDDGQVWTIAPPARCGVRPDPLMLISPR